MVATGDVAAVLDDRVNALDFRLDDGAAMLFVTHDIEQGKRLAKRALFIDAGKARQGDL